VAELYAIEGDRILPTQYTAGPWSDELQHAGPPAAMLGRALAPPEDDGLAFARITFDILRPVPIQPLRIETRVLRPTLTLDADGTELMRATAWRVAAAPFGDASEPEPAPPPPGESRAITLPWWDTEVNYQAALEWRLATGSIDVPGPACVWSRMRIPLVAGEETTPLQHLLVMGDAASGVSWALDWDRFTFPNVDFSVHLQRVPHGEWLAMDAVTRIGPESFGQTTSVLHDLGGRIGHTTQTLVVAAR
jgi:hypothetical protein